MNIERRISMNTKKYTARIIVAACGLALTSMSGFAAAQTSPRQGTTTDNPPANSRTSSNEALDAAQQVSDSANVVRQMERDAGLKQLLQQAQGVLIIPKY